MTVFEEIRCPSNQGTLCDSDCEYDGWWGDKVAEYSGYIMWQWLCQYDGWWGDKVSEYSGYIMWQWLSQYDGWWGDKVSEYSGYIMWQWLSQYDVGEKIRWLSIQGTLCDSDWASMMVGEEIRCPSI